MTVPEPLVGNASPDAIKRADQALMFARDAVATAAAEASRAREMAQQAARQAAAVGAPVEVIARRLGVAASTVARWLG